MLKDYNINAPLSFMKQEIRNYNPDDMQIQDPFLTFLDLSIDNINDIGGKTLKALMRLVGGHYKDLLYHLPIHAISRNKIDFIDVDQHVNNIISIEGMVKNHTTSHKKGAPDRVSIMVEGKDGPILLQLIYFRLSGQYLRQLLPVGATRIISGKLETFDTNLQIVHPEYVIPPDRYDDLPKVQPIYPLTAGLTQRMALKAMKEVTKDIPVPPEWIHPDVMKKNNWVGLSEALKTIHNPKDPQDCDPQSIYRRRLAYDRILAHQLHLGQMRSQRKLQPKRVFDAKGTLCQIIRDNLPFSLTKDQEFTLSDIQNDLKKGEAISRLVQGDVGSGKTIVALMAASLVIEQGAQAAIMAPTEILAKQHYHSLKEYCDPAGLRCGILTGKDKEKQAKITLDALKNGEIDLLIGTHALIQKRVIFKNLALGIIDEQHRFGVKQRSALSEKGKPYAHIIAMAATPIPRTLALAQYGDTDFSIISEKPPGRKPIATKVMPITKIYDVAKGLERVIHKGQRAYWVCPLVEESEKIDLIAAEQRYETLKEMFGDQIGIVHGKMKAVEKDEVIKKFSVGDISILVSTTVIEVGVNVPQATIMVIEQAERFGLSQLHQLRGRVGRGSLESSCILLYKSPLSVAAQERLKTIRSSEDGFFLAEKDLELRGAGDFLGTKQTGLLSLEGFDFSFHSDLVPTARKDVKVILEADPTLVSPRGEALRQLLEIFEQERNMVKSLTI